MIKEFEPCKFKQFVITFLVLPNTKDKRTLQYVDAISQFDMLPSEYLNISYEGFRKYINTHFIIRDKPKNVQISNWLLNLYGFKLCSSCKQVKSLSNFNNTKTYWDGLSYTCKDCQSLYKKNNKQMYRNNSAKRRALLLNRTFPGVDKEIRMFYLNCPINMQVDHIIPLQGKYISGLHVPWNLEYKTPSDNISKGNYHESEESWK